jgi:chromosome segregation ATPase
MSDDPIETMLAYRDAKSGETRTAPFKPWSKDEVLELRAEVKRLSAVAENQKDRRHEAEEELERLRAELEEMDRELGLLRAELRLFRTKESGYVEAR